jgi:hypothetical protein
LLLLPVQVEKIRLGQPVDVLLDAEAWRALGFVVLCGDESQRFLPYLAAELRDDEIAVPSALVLLEAVEFYRGRSRSLRALLGAPVVKGRRELGELRDVLLTRDGSVAALVTEHDDATREVEPDGARIGHASAA